MEIQLTNIKKSKTCRAYTQAWINQTFNRCKTRLIRPIITTTTITVLKCKLIPPTTKVYRASYTKPVWWILRCVRITPSWIGRKLGWKAKWSTRGKCCSSFKLNSKDKSNKMKKRYTNWARNYKVSWSNLNNANSKYRVQVPPVVISPLEVICNNLKVWK